MPFLSGVIEEQILSPLRLDRYVSEYLRLFSRSQIKTRNLKAKINGKDVKNSHSVKHGDRFELCWDESPPENIIAQDIPLDVVYEDKNCIVVNKNQGMVVHPGAGNRQGTLANAVYFRRLNSGGFIANNARTGIVHRLDKDTSGIIIAAYNDEAHVFLANQFKTRKTRKIYVAIIHGTPKETSGRIETFLARNTGDRRRFAVSANGKNAVTFFKIIKKWEKHSFVLLSPRTGRTHQLRVHMRHIGHPILGDPVYGIADGFFPEVSLMLHSKNLSITLYGETERRNFSSKIPERFLSVIEKLNRMQRHG